MKKPIIAITGATGLIGRYLASLLRQEGFQLRLVGRDFNALSSLRSREDEIVQTDYQNNLHEAFANVDAIVHLAGIRNSKKVDFNSYLDNVKCTYQVLDEANRLGITNIIYSSSLQIYRSKVIQNPVSEKDILNPETDFAICSFMAESICEFFNNYKNFKIKCLRIGVVVGPGSGGVLFEEFLSRTKADLPLEIWGDSSEGHDYIAAEDVAMAILAAIKKPELKGVFNIGSGKLISKKELADHFTIFSQQPVSYVHRSLNGDSPIWMSIKKSGEQLGWAPRFNMSDILNKIFIKN